MNFKFYDILSSLVPGFIMLMVFLYIQNINYNKDWLLPYTAIAFLLGYIVNSICSWLEGFYYFSWGGCPSNQLLHGHDIWKVRFHDADRVRQYLINDLNDPSSTDEKLFHEAMRQVNGKSKSRIEDFNAHYAFSRSLLTTSLIVTVLLLVKNYDNWIFYAFTLPCLFVVWLRCKQKAYYYAREVLNEYLKGKTSSIT